MFKLLVYFKLSSLRIHRFLVIVFVAFKKCTVKTRDLFSRKKLKSKNNVLLFFMISSTYLLFVILEIITYS